MPHSSHTWALCLILVAQAGWAEILASKPAEIEAARRALEGAGLSQAEYEAARGHLDAALASEHAARALEERVAALRSSVAGSPRAPGNVPGPTAKERARAASEWQFLEQQIASVEQAELAKLYEQALAQERATAGDGSIDADLAEANRRRLETLIEESDGLAGERKTLIEHDREGMRIAQKLRDSRVRLALKRDGRDVGAWLWSVRRRLEPVQHLDREL